MTDSSAEQDQSTMQWQSTFDWSLSETARVEARLAETFGDRVFNFTILLGLLPNGTRRISTEIASQTVQDTVAVVHASRVYGDAMGAYLLLRKGLWTQATTLARSTLESVAQVVALLRDANMAEQWATGKRFTPAAIRKSLGSHPDFAPLYNALSSIAHANPEATWSHSIPVQGLGFAISYGGSYQPKRGVTLLTILVDLVLIYLHEFYDHYFRQLAILSWPLLIEMGHAMNKDLREWADKLPEDWEELAKYVATMKPEPMPSSPVTREEALRWADKLRASRLGLPDGDELPSLTTQVQPTSE